MTDAVILAAGRGARLEGVAAPFWKPLMVVNGEPLIATVTKQARLIGNDPVVVVSPENAQPICQVLAAHGLTRADIVVQPNPAGPGDAVLRAASLLGADTMILCADNVIPDEDICKVLAAEGPLVIGTRTIPDDEEAGRFTLIGEQGNICERREEAEDINFMRWTDGDFRAWVGPLRAPTKRLVECLRRQKGHQRELKIGQALERWDGRPELVPVNCYDIGVT